MSKRSEASTFCPIDPVQDPSKMINELKGKGCEIVKKSYRRQEDVDTGSIIFSQKKQKKTKQENHFFYSKHLVFFFYKPELRHVISTRFNCRIMGL